MLQLGQRIRHLYVDQLKFMPKTVSEPDAPRRTLARKNLPTMRSLGFTLSVGERERMSLR